MWPPYEKRKKNFFILYWYNERHSDMVFFLTFPPAPGLLTPSPWKTIIISVCPSTVFTMSYIHNYI